MPGCSGWGRTAILSPRSAAQGFADHRNAILNATVSDARLTILAAPGYDNQFTIACLDGPRAGPFALLGSSLRLLLSQTGEVIEGRCHTVTYAYRLSSGDAKSDWLLRWEYFGRPPRPDYAYPLAHAHVNAALLDADAEGVETRTPDWQDLLRDSRAGFEECRSSP